jgi:hypothetical protein
LKRFSGCICYSYRLAADSSLSAAHYAAVYRLQGVILQLTACIQQHIMLEIDSSYLSVGSLLYVHAAPQSAAVFLLAASHMEADS